MGFDLASLQKTKRPMPARMLVYGPPGIGKTTFAACAPNAVGILTEDGAAGVDAVAFPLCQSMADVNAALQTVLTQPHGFQSLFIDSLDHLEPLLWAHTATVNSIKSVEGEGYGRGFAMADHEWRKFLSMLDAIHKQRMMHVILIAHSKEKKYSPPTGEGYERFQPKLHDRAMNLIIEWADFIGLAAQKVLLNKVDAGFGSKEAKAFTTDERQLHLSPNPAYLAKNRFGLPPALPLAWVAFQNALYPPANPTLTTALQPGVTQPIVPEQQPDAAAGQQDPAASTQTDDQFART